MRVAHIVPCRDKERYVAASVRSVLDQTYPCHVVLSDQGSTDRSFEVMRSISLSYSGPHKITVLRCPVTEPRGMRGMNAHLDWIMSMIDEDVVLITSADDLALPERNAKVVAAFEAHKPDMVLTAFHTVQPDGKYSGTTVYGEEGMVPPNAMIESLVGGSTAHSWTREFYQAVGGFAGICAFDAFWPFLASVRNGAWFIKEPLHLAVQHADPNNTGLEGIHRAADERGKLAIEELMHFQVQAAYIKAAVIMEDWECNDPDTKNMLLNAILERAVSWSRVRETMSLQGVEPRSLRV